MLAIAIPGNQKHAAFFCFTKKSQKNITSSTLSFKRQLYKIGRPLGSLSVRKPCVRDDTETNGDHHLDPTPYDQVTSSRTLRIVALSSENGGAYGLRGDRTFRPGMASFRYSCPPLPGLLWRHFGTVARLQASRSYLLALYCPDALAVLPHNCPTCCPGTVLTASRPMMRATLSLKIYLPHLSDGGKHGRSEKHSNLTAEVSLDVLYAIYKNVWLFRCFGLSEM